MRARQLRQGLLIAFYLLVACWLASLIWGLTSKAKVAVSEARDAELRYQSLEERKSKLQANLANLETPLGQDAAIRAAFGVAREGEEVIVVVPPTPSTTTPERTWFGKVRDWFLKRN